VLKVLTRQVTIESSEVLSKNEQKWKNPVTESNIKARMTNQSRGIS
jgi:hypothetical protein